MPDPDQNANEPMANAQEQPLRSEDLLRGKRQIEIVHQGEVYRLLVTRNGKLILQK